MSKCSPCKLHRSSRRGTCGCRIHHARPIVEGSPAHAAAENIRRGGRWRSTVLWYRVGSAARRATTPWIDLKGWR
jgi:hypothetical protein